MLKLYSNIKRLREQRGLSQEALAKLTGYTDRSSIAKIEKGSVDLQQSKIELFAKALGTTVKDLVGWDDENDIHLRKSISINVYGVVPAGIPLEMIEDIIDTEDITDELARTGTFFGLKIKGDSMIPDIHDGDIVIVRQQDDAESGDTVIATINSDEATCKRLRKYKEGIELIANNPNYKPLYFNNNDIEQKPIRIIGKVVELRRTF